MRCGSLIPRDLEVTMEKRHKSVQSHSHDISLPHTGAGCASEGLLTHINTLRELNMKWRSIFSDLQDLCVYFPGSHVTSELVGDQ